MSYWRMKARIFGGPQVYLVSCWNFDTLLCVLLRDLGSNDIAWMLFVSDKFPESSVQTMLNGTLKPVWIQNKHRSKKEDMDHEHLDCEFTHGKQLKIFLEWKAGGGVQEGWSSNRNNKQTQNVKLQNTQICSFNNWISFFPKGNAHYKSTKEKIKWMFS